LIVSDGGFACSQVNADLPVVHNDNKNVDKSQSLRAVVERVVQGIDHEQIQNAWMHTERFKTAMLAYMPIYGDVPTPELFTEWQIFRNEHCPPSGDPAPTREVVMLWEDKHPPSDQRLRLSAVPTHEAGDISG
jgi:hypothetical protein